jgi:predicted nucleic acid-binding protein
MPEPSDRVVVDAGPLIALSAVGHLELLHQVYGRVVVPQAVLAEIDVPGYDRTAVLGADWLERVALTAAPPPWILSKLDAGETSVIMTALEQSIRLVLIDERKGRRVARAAGLQVAGTVGVLLRAKRLGHLAAVRPALQQLKSSGLWLSDELIERAATAAGE